MTSVRKRLSHFQEVWDSAYLLYAAVQSGADVKPYFIKTPFQPESELRDARLLAEELGTELTVLEHDVLADEQAGFESS